MVAPTPREDEMKAGPTTRATVGSDHLARWAR
jgi:hypothetical protein